MKRDGVSRAIFESVHRDYDKYQGKQGGIDEASREASANDVSLEEFLEKALLWVSCRHEECDAGGTFLDAAID